MVIFFLKKSTVFIIFIQYNFIQSITFYILYLQALSKTLSLKEAIIVLWKEEMFTNNFYTS